MLNRDFAEMLSALSAEGVRFLLVGAHALGAHGIVRATGDIDIWVRPASDNAERVMKALVRFGAPLFDLSRDDLSRPGTVFQLGMPPARIDILTSIDGVEFDEAWSGRLKTTIDEMPISVLGRAELLRNKRAADRPKDRIDVKSLEANAPKRRPTKRPRRKR